MKNCAWCGRPHGKEISAINRAKRIGAPLYCNRKCAGFGRRSNKSKSQKVEEKRLYDAAYRKRNLALLKAKKAAYFQRTYNPKKAAIERKKRMHLHVEYCRQPHYRAYKHDYDRVYLAKRRFGAYWEAALLVRQIDEEVQSRMSKYEIGLAHGTINKALKRRREYEAQRSTTLIRC